MRAGRPRRRAAHRRSSSRPAAARRPCRRAPRSAPSARRACPLEVRARARRRRSRTCPAGCPACRCRSSEPAVIWPYIVRPSALELAELVPGGPIRDEIGVGDEHARRVGVRAEAAHGACPTARAASRRRLEASRSSRTMHVERLPGARGLPGAAVDDQVVAGARRPRVEVVVQHAERGFLDPAFARELGAARGANGAGEAHGTFASTTAAPVAHRRRLWH